MTQSLAAIVLAGIVLPHALRLQRVHPVTATVLWLSSLALRALAGVFAVIFLLFYLPRTHAFAAVTHWCFGVVVPLVDADMHLEGHGIGDVALLLPGIALGASLIYMCQHTTRSARQARRLLDHAVLGDGPRGSLIVGGPEVVFAVAGLVRPRIVVSAGALTRLDDDELDAALSHERAHIVRRHRFVMLIAVAFGALGRGVPGTRRALRELAFHLERDADRWALAQRHDRLALASVICKAVTDASAARPGLVGLGGAGVRERLGQLLADQPARQGRPAAAALNALATAMVISTMLLAAMLPPAAAAGVGDDAHGAHHGHHCHH